MSNITRWATFWSYRRTNSVLVPGDELVGLCQRMFGLQSGIVFVSYNGVDPKRFSRRNRSRELRRKIGSRHIVIFSGSGIDVIRGLDILLRAVPLIRRKIPDVRAVITGPPRTPASISRLSKLAENLEISDCVEFVELDVGFVPRYMASADVGVGALRELAYSYGASPLKIVEYMASGCIAIACRGAVTSSLIRDKVNGLLTTPGDHDALAKNISKVFSDAKMARRIRARARRTVVRKFSWDVIGTELETRLQAVAKVN